MTENKRFVAIDDSELYYITDTKNLKTLDDYIKEFSKPEYEFTEEEALSTAKEEYWQMIYENSMSAKENVDWLNNLIEENEQLKQQMEKYNEISEKICNWDFDEIVKVLDAQNETEKENEQLKRRISELKEDNDHKFWKLEFIHQFNSTQLIVNEISRAIKQGYEVSDKFQEYINELKERNEKGREKAIEQEK